MKPGELRLEDRTEGTRHRILLTGELDIASTPILEDAIARVCADHATEVTLDLGGISFIDSTGLRTIINSQQLCDCQRCEFSLVGATAAVQNLFRLTGLTERLPLREDRAERQTAP